MVHPCRLKWLRLIFAESLDKNDWQYNAEVWRVYLDADCICINDTQPATIGTHFMEWTSVHDGSDIEERVERARWMELPRKLRDMMEMLPA